MEDLTKNEEVTMEEYCEKYCPQRFNSECWNDCDARRENEEDCYYDNL